LVPEANFVRTADYCSAVFLMVRTDVVRQLGGFDDDLAPAYYEDADLCIRIRQAGYDVEYNPSIVVFHLEHGSSQGGAAAAAGMIRNRDGFSKKHADYLQGRPTRNDRVPHSSPRFAERNAKRILLIEDTVPLRLMGSGYVRCNDIIQVMASLGYQVTVFPIQRSQFDVASIYRDMPDTIEVMYNKGVDSLPEFLVERRDYYNAVWVARTHNLSWIRRLLDSILVTGPGRPVIVLDTEAIVANRDAANTAVTGGETRDLASAIKHELRHADICQTIIAVSEEEAYELRRLGWDNVSVIGHMRRLLPTPRAFADRAGILFVGAMHQQSSPNYDSLVWFVDEVLPIIEQRLQWQTRLTVVGYTAPGVSLERFVNHPRVTLRGMIADTEPLYDQHRVFVAPTRFAAGLPYKIYEAASFGLPVVATELLRRQMNWQNGIDLLSADPHDPELLAKHVIALYEDEALWQQIRANALDRLLRENSYADYAKAIERVLSLPTGSPAKLD
jgi:glycosyltransferase involved in cell wall biosynthesis